MGVSKGMEFLGQRCSCWAERLLEDLPDYNNLMDGGSWFAQNSPVRNSNRSVRHRELSMVPKNRVCGCECCISIKPPTSVQGLFTKGLCTEDRGRVGQGPKLLLIPGATKSFSPASPIRRPAKAATDYTAAPDNPITLRASWRNIPRAPGSCSPACS